MSKCQKPCWGGKRYYDFGRIDKIKSAGWHKFRRNFGGAGKGVPHGHGLSGVRGRGDLMIKAVIRTPRKISKKAKDLIEELKKKGFKAV